MARAAYTWAHNVVGYCRDGSTQAYEAPGVTEDDLGQMVAGADLDDAQQVEFALFLTSNKDKALEAFSNLVIFT